MRDVGEGGDQQQAHHVLRILAVAEVRIDGLRHRATAGGDVVSDGVLQRGVDLVDLGEGLAVLKIEVVSGDETGIVLGVQMRETTIRIRRISPRVC